MIRILPFVVLLALPLAQAQETPVGLEAELASESTNHVLQISEGNVYFDGELLPDAAPEGLDLRGIQLDFTYDERFMEPVVMLDGVSYVLEDKKLVSLQDSRRAGETVYPVAEQPAEGDAARTVASRVPEAYMRELSEEDRSLYEKFQRESEIETTILQLARQIRDTSPGESRDELVEQLREQIAQAFDLRQQIHQEELERARRQLEDANDALIRRADVREEIIDARMEELIGEE